MHCAEAIEPPPTATSEATKWATAGNPDPNRCGRTPDTKFIMGVTPIVLPVKLVKARSKAGPDGCLVCPSIEAKWRKPPLRVRIRALFFGNIVASSPVVTSGGLAQMAHWEPTSRLHATFLRMTWSYLVDELDDLKQAAAGDLEALHRVGPMLHDRIRAIAHDMLAHDRAKKWVQASSLVNMAFLRLTEQRQIDFADEARVTAAIVTIMRRIVIDVVRRERALKRGGGVSAVGLHGDEIAAPEAPVDALDMEDAMVALSAVCAESARVAELRLWGGMELQQIAVALDIPFSRARSRWNRAKAWLQRELSDGQRGLDP